MIKKATTLWLSIFTVLIPLILYGFLTFFDINNNILYPMITSILIGILCFYLSKITKKKDVTIHHLTDRNIELNRYNELKDVMLQISNSIVHIKNMDELLQLFVDSVVQVVDHADIAGVLVKNDDDLLEFKAVHGLDLKEVSNIKFSMYESYLFSHDYHKATIIKNPQYFSNIDSETQQCYLFEKLNALKIKTTIRTPIMIDHQLYGFISVNNLHNEGIFTEDDKVIMEYLTGQLSLAIKNVLLFEKTLFLSRYDGLTKVYHRHYFDELFDNIHIRAKRYNEQFCLCIMDLNNFKQINDSYGHFVGDMAIKHFSDILKENVRSSDILGRFGGDEFVLIFLNTNLEDAQKKMQSISDLVSKKPIVHGKDQLYLQFSFGISEFPTDSSNSKELFKLADSRMYQSKANKKAM